MLIYSVENALGSVAAVWKHNTVKLLDSLPCGASFLSEGCRGPAAEPPGPWSPLVFLEQNTRAYVWVVMLQLWRSSDRVRAWWFVFSCKNSDKNVDVGIQRSEGWALPAQPCFCIRDGFLLPLFTATFVANRQCVTEKSRRSGIHLVSAFQPGRKPALG